jgi:hypothetical protein
LLRFARNDEGRLIARSFLLALALTGGAHADETPASTNPAEEANLKNFGASHRECLEWSDGCSVCKLFPRGVPANGVIAEMDYVACSLPGIACQPADIACRAP